MFGRFDRRGYNHSMSGERHKAKRWQQLSLRAALGVVLIICILFCWLAFRLNHARQRHAAVETLSKLGGIVFYKNPNEPMNDEELFRAGEMLESQWIEEILGADFVYDVVTVNLERAKAGDGDLVHLKPLNQTRFLYLGGPGFTDAGLAHLAGMTQLEDLGLIDTRIIGDGFAHLPHLKTLSLSGSRVTDEQLSYLKNLPDLTCLYLRDTRITDAGLAHLEPLVHLVQLQLKNSPIDGSGFVHLESLPDFQVLIAEETRLNDACLTSLKTLKRLRHVSLIDTMVTDEGAADLQSNLPSCHMRIKNSPSPRKVER